MSDENSEKLAVPQQRSPTFPYIALDLAVARAKQIYSAIREHPQPREVLARAYGKPATSSATIQTFATLLQYGLLENVVGPTGRKMRISSLAQTILNPHAPPEKIQQALKTAALNPAVFEELWNLYGDLAGLSDSVPLYYLTEERGHEHGGVYTEKAAQDVLRVYRATLAYAGISGSANNQQSLAVDAEVVDTPTPKASVGDFVLVEIDGSIQFKDPKRVDAIKEHDGKTWVFLEGEKAAVEMDNVTVQPAPDLSARNSVPPVRELPDTDLAEGWSEERLIDDGGDEIKIRYRGKASQGRYEFIRDYLDFKIQRLSKKGS
jgi:hypothetical protein